MVQRKCNDEKNVTNGGVRSPSGLVIKQREKTLSRIANTRRRIQMYLPCIAFLFVLCFIFLRFMGWKWLKVQEEEKGVLFNPIFSANMLHKLGRLIIFCLLSLSPRDESCYGIKKRKRVNACLWNPNYILKSHSLGRKSDKRKCRIFIARHNTLSGLLSDLLTIVWNI